MKRPAPFLPLLAGVGLLCGALGFGLGRIGKGTVEENAGDAAKGEAAVDSTLEPAAVTGQSEAEKAARGEVRAFVPGRPFPKGGAEKWLLGFAKGEDELMVDPGRIMASIRQLGNLDAESAREVAEALVSINARVDADEAGDEAALWEGSGVVRSFGLIAVLGIVAGEDPEGALAVLGAMKDADEEYVATVWSDIARQAPERVESLLAGQDAEALPLALSGVVRGLFDSDPEAALALLAEYRGEDFEEVRDFAILRVQETDPRRGTKLAADFVKTGEDTGPLSSAISNWLDEDEAGARAWVENYQGPGRDAARARLLLHDAREDPRGAMDEYAALHARGEAGEELTLLAGMITEGLAEGDVASARTWVEALPQGPEREEAAGTLVSAWVREDATAASEWVAALPGGQARDTAAEAIARGIAGSDPAGAFAWAHSIGDEKARESAADWILETWIKKDPAAAYAAAAAQAAARRDPE